MTKIIVDKDQLEKLLEKLLDVIGNDCPKEIFNKGISYCPAEILNKEIPWCSEEFCINCKEYDCIKKWLDVKELPHKEKANTGSEMVEKQLIETLKNIKNYCKLTGCHHCKFTEEYSIICGIREMMLVLNECPHNWDIEEIEKLIEEKMENKKEKLVNTNDIEEIVDKKYEEKYKMSVLVLDLFSKLWCRDEYVKNDLEFMCEDCPFLTDNGSCLVKIFKEKYYPTYKDFGSMGDL